MLKKLSRIGSSKGLILDKTLLGLLGIENAEEVSITVEGRRLIIAPPYEKPVEELRARLAKSPDDDATDAALNAATRQARAETVHKRKASHGVRRAKGRPHTQIAE
jgi:antitoxin component of MazEF toxin-antitoxin module